MINSVYSQNRRKTADLQPFMLDKPKLIRYNIDIPQIWFRSASRTVTSRENIFYIILTVATGTQPRIRIHKNKEDKMSYKPKRRNLRSVTPSAKQTRFVDLYFSEHLTGKASMGEIHKIARRRQFCYDTENEMRQISMNKGKRNYYEHYRRII